METENNGADNGRDSKGKFLPGNPGKPKGASKNKLRDEIKSFIGDQWQDFPNWFNELKPKEKIETVLALLPFVCSRLQSVSTTDTEGNDLQNPMIDYTRLRPETLSEILDATTILK